MFPDGFHAHQKLLAGRHDGAAVLPDRAGEHLGSSVAFRGALEELSDGRVEHPIAFEMLPGAVAEHPGRAVEHREIPK